MYWKKLQLLQRRHIHRTQVAPSFAFACEVKGKGPNLEGKRGLTGTLVNWVLWQLAAHTSSLLLWVLTLLLSCMSTWWELGENTLGTLRIQKTQRFSPPFLQEKKRKKTGPFGCLLPCLMGCKEFMFPMVFSDHPCLLALNTPLHCVGTFMDTTYMCWAEVTAITDNMTKMLLNHAYSRRLIAWDN